MNVRILLPADTEISVFDSERSLDDEMPVYEGQVMGAFMSIEAGLYPFTYEYDDGKGKLETEMCLLVVTDDESFAVTTAVEYPSVYSVTLPLSGI